MEEYKKIRQSALRRKRNAKRVLVLDANILVRASSSRKKGRARHIEPPVTSLQVSVVTE